MIVSRFRRPKLLRFISLCHSDQSGGCGVGMANTTFTKSFAGGQHCVYVSPVCLSVRSLTTSRSPCWSEPLRTLLSLCARRDDVARFNYSRGRRRTADPRRINVFARARKYTGGGGANEEDVLAGSAGVVKAGAIVQRDDGGRWNARRLFGGEHDKIAARTDGQVGANPLLDLDGRLDQTMAGCRRVEDGVVCSVVMRS